VEWGHAIAGIKYLEKKLTEFEKLEIFLLDYTLTLFCRLPSLNLEKMDKIGEKVPNFMAKPCYLGFYF